MTHYYIEILEQIVLEMDSAIKSGSQEISAAEYSAWANFLKYVRLGSSSKGKVKDMADHEPTVFSDLREIMMLAEAAGYPMWHIQPKFSEELVIEYTDGKLVNVSMKKNGKTEELKENEKESIPDRLKDFTGKLYGIWRERQNEKPLFVAFDTDQKMDFLDRMKWLESVGLTIAEYVLFPTDKIPITPKSKLTVFFQNYLFKAREQGLKVEGVVIISKTPIIQDDSHPINDRIILSSA